jgi:hypothetical protein
MIRDFVRDIMHLFITFIMVCFAAFPVVAKDAVNFISKPLAAGKAFVADNGYVVSSTIGIANFSPELRLPVQVAYYSSSQKTGMFGFGWRSPPA